MMPAPETASCEWCGSGYDPKPGKRYCCGYHRELAQRQRRRQRQVQARFCLDYPKPEYPDESAAEAAAAQLARIPPLYPYPCPRGHWHLSSRPPEDTDTIRRLR